MLTRGMSVREAECFRKARFGGVDAQAEVRQASPWGSSSYTRERSFVPIYAADRGDNWRLTPRAEV